MIYFNLVDFSERRSEEVMFHLTFSLYIFKPDGHTVMRMLYSGTSL